MKCNVPALQEIRHRWDIGAFAIAGTDTKANAASELFVSICTEWLCVSRPAMFSGRVVYEAPKPGFSYVSLHVNLLFSVILFSFFCVGNWLYFVLLFYFAYARQAMTCDQGCISHNKEIRV